MTIISLCSKIIYKNTSGDVVMLDIVWLGKGCQLTVEKRAIGWFDVTWLVIHDAIKAHKWMQLKHLRILSKIFSTGYPDREWNQCVDVSNFLSIFSP